MHYKSLKHVFLTLITSVFLLKIFTAIVSFHDEPYSFFVLKKTPSITNEIIIDSDEAFRHYLVVMSDENKLIGQDIYYLLVDNISIISLFFIYIFIYSGIRHQKSKY